MHEHVISGLVKRRSVLACEIEEAHAKLRRMIIDLENLDATILQFDPNYKTEEIKPKAFRPPKDWAGRNEMSRLILTILRKAAEPMTARDLAHQMLAERAMDKDDPKLLRLMTKRIGVALRHQRDNGVVQSAAGPGMYLVWEIAR